MAGRPASPRRSDGISTPPARPAPVFEYVSPKVFNSLLRRELVSPEPEVMDGYMALPDRPGLGIDLNEELVSRLRTDRS